MAVEHSPGSPAVNTVLLSSSRNNPTDAHTMRRQAAPAPSGAPPDFPSPHRERASPTGCRDWSACALPSTRAASGAAVPSPSGAHAEPNTAAARDRRLSCRHRTGVATARRTPAGRTNRSTRVGPRPARPAAPWRAPKRRRAARVPRRGPRPGRSTRRSPTRVRRPRSRFRKTSSSRCSDTGTETRACSAAEELIDRCAFGDSHVRQADRSREGQAARHALTNALAQPLGRRTSQHASAVGRPHPPCEPVWSSSTTWVRPGSGRSTCSRRTRPTPSWSRGRRRHRRSWKVCDRQARDLG